MKQIIIALVIIFIFVVVGAGIALLFRGGGGGGTGGSRGVVVSTDGGNRWEKRIQIDDEKTIGGVNVLTLVQHPAEEEVWYLGSRGNGAFRTRTKGRQWERLDAKGTFPTSGDVRAFVFDPSSHATVYAAVYRGGRGALLKSDDDGETFREVFRTARDVPIYGVALDPTASRTVYIGTGDGRIVKSSDRGESWQRLATLEAAVFDIHVNPRNPRELFALIYKKGIARSRDGGVTWESLRKSLRSFRKADNGNMLLIDHVNPRHLYYASSNGLIESFDGGDNWEGTSFVGPPREVPVLALAQSKDAPHILYASADTLLYRSNDYGKSWSVTGLRTSSRVSQIVINAFNGQEIFVGLHE